MHDSFPTNELLYTIISCYDDDGNWKKCFYDISSLPVKAFGFPECPLGPAKNFFPLGSNLPLKFSVFLNS